MQSDRLKKVQDHLCTLNSLCSVLGLDFEQTASGVHPSLGNSEGSKSVNNDTIKQLAVAIQELREVKLQRMQKVRSVLNMKYQFLFINSCYFLQFNVLTCLWSGSFKILQQQCWSSGI